MHANKPKEHAGYLSLAMIYDNIAGAWALWFSGVTAYPFCYSPCTGVTTMKHRWVKVT